MNTLRDPNRRPTHPGAVLREDVLPDLGWTQGELAARLLVSRVTVSDILHEKKIYHCRDGCSHFTGSGWITRELASYARGFGYLGGGDEIQKQS